MLLRRLLLVATPTEYSQASGEPRWRMPIPDLTQLVLSSTPR